MSMIGKYQFSDSCVIHVVNAMGASCPAQDDPEVGLEVECVLYCDDPEDGVYGTDITATIEGTDMELSGEAVELLGLSARAGEIFMDSGHVHPKAGEKFMDRDDVTWEVVVSAMHNEYARDYTTLKRKVHFPITRRHDGWRYMIIETVLLLSETREDTKLDWRVVVEEDEPTGTDWRGDSVVYVGKPK